MTNGKGDGENGDKDMDCKSDTCDNNDRDLFDEYNICIHDAFIVKYEYGYDSSAQGPQSRGDHNTASDPCPVDHQPKHNAHHHQPLPLATPTRDETTRPQRYLPLHMDQSTHSLTIALNTTDAYTGGGTFFVDLNKAIRPDTGHVLSFRGDLLHGGDPITSGTRYIIAAFLLIAAKSPVQLLKERYVGEGGGSSLCEGENSEKTSLATIATIFRSHKEGADDLCMEAGSMEGEQADKEEGELQPAASSTFSFGFMTE